MDLSPRDAAAQRFENAAFNAADPIGSVNELKAAALARIDVEIKWYETHANRRLFMTWVTRGLVLLLALLGVLILEVNAFAPDKAPKVYAKFDIDPALAPLIATTALIIAGFILLADRTFLLTRSYIRFRVTEYELRVRRAMFASEFDRVLNSATTVVPAVFLELQGLAHSAFKAVFEDIRKETALWSEDLKVAMESMAKDIEKITASSRERAEAAAKRATAAAEAAASATRRATLTVLVKEHPDRKAPVSIFIEGDQNIEVKNVVPGSRRGIPLSGGIYVVHLRDATGQTLSSAAKRVGAGADETLDL